MCVSALVLSKGITFCYAGLAGVVMWGRYAGLTLPNLCPREHSWVFIVFIKLFYKIYNLIIKLVSFFFVGTFGNMPCSFFNEAAFLTLQSFTLKKDAIFCCVQLSGANVKRRIRFLFPAVLIFFLMFSKSCL